MNVLFVSRKYHPYVGGVATQTRLVANRLAARHSVAVAAMIFKDSSEGPSDGSSGKIIRGAREQAKKSLKDGWVLSRLKGAAEVGRSLTYALQWSAGRAADDGRVTVYALAPSFWERIVLVARSMPASVGLLIRGVDWRDTFRSRFYSDVFAPFYVPKLRRLIRDRNVVHCVADGYLGWAAEEAARDENKAFVLTPYVHPGFHGEDTANAAFYQRADIVFALIETGREKLVEIGVDRERIRISGVVPLLPESSDSSAFRQRLGIGANPVVLFVGRMEPYKGFLALLHAATNVWRELPDAHFVFIGPGSVEARTAFAGSDHRIHYLGLVSDEEKGNALAACDLFCMPSVAEILPAVYLEAWTYGKPVIGGTAHGLAELIEGSGGGVTVAQDPEVLAATIVGLLRDEPRRRRMGDAGRALVGSRFSESAVMLAFERGYQEACTGHSPATVTA